MGVVFRLKSSLTYVFSLGTLTDFLRGKKLLTLRSLTIFCCAVGFCSSLQGYSGELAKTQEPASLAPYSDEFLAKSFRKDNESLTAMHGNNDCRFFVDGLGKVRTKILDGRYSILAMRVELVVNIPRANVLRVGQWSRWVDGRITETSSLAYPPRLSEEHGFDPQSGRYVIQTPFSWGQQLCPGCVNNDEFSGQISELCWWIDFINENGEEERIWYSDYGRNFHIDEQFSWPTYAAGTTDKIILWLDHNAPIFSARHDCGPN